MPAWPTGVSFGPLRLADRLGLPQLTVHKQAGDPYGTGVMIDGTRHCPPSVPEPVDPEDGVMRKLFPPAKVNTVCLIEDVVTTGHSTLQALDTLNGHGYHITHLIVICDRLQCGIEAIKATWPKLNVLVLATIAEVRAAYVRVAPTD